MSPSKIFNNRIKYQFDRFIDFIDYDSKDTFYYIALISAPILLTVYRYFTEAQNFVVYFPFLSDSNDGEVFAYVLEYFSFFILFLIIPFFIIKIYGKNNILKEFIGLPVLNKSIIWGTVILIVVAIGSAYSASTIDVVLTEYPLPRSLMNDQNQLWLYLAAYLLFYYIPWEFFFRGFLLFGLKEKYGTVAAILIQTISSCLVHIDKPAVEIMGSIPIGILFGIVALWTRSIWVVVLLHAALGIFTDLFIIF